MNQEHYFGPMYDPIEEAKMYNQVIRELKPGIYLICREGNRVKAIQDVTTWTASKVAEIADIQRYIGREAHIKRIEGR